MFRAVVLGLLCALIALGQTPDSSLLQRAVTLHQSGDYAGAIEAYQQFLKAHPEAAPVRSNLGAALAHEGRYDDAIREYTEALQADPNNAAVRLNLALAYYKALRIRDAIPQLEQVHAKDPSNAQASLLLANCYLQTGENKKALALLEPQATATNTDRAFAYTYGLALMRDNQTDRAQIWLDTILRDGDSAEARLLMGTARLRANDFANAKSDFARAVDLNPKLPQAHALLGLTLLRMGDTNGAAAAFRKELEIEPNDFDATLQLGGLLRQDEKYSEAQQYIDRALRLRPNDPGARYQKASLDLLAGNVAEARSTLEALVKDEPEFVEAHVSLATAYYREKRKPEGDHEREIVRQLNAAAQAKQPGAAPDKGTTR